MHARPAAPLALALLLLQGCVVLTPRLITSDGPPSAADVRIHGAVFHLEYTRADDRTVKSVADALEIAVPRLERWGAFEQPVFVRIQPSHEALEIAVRREGWPWLRAWARYDSIDLQSPRTWSLLGASQAQLVELLTHELTHCLMYQRAATAEDWMRKDIPLWFREGMASFTAEQGYRRPTEEDLWRYIKSNPDKDPVMDAETLYQSEADIVYGSSHRAFEFLVQRYGEESVRSIMTAMRKGAGFPQAFETVVGVAERGFTQEFAKYVRWEGWRGRKGKRPPGGAAGDPPKG